MALSVEASELVEIFQWLTEEESKNLGAENKQRAAHELADIFLYTLLSCDKLGINLQAAVEEKISVNELRFSKNN